MARNGQEEWYDVTQGMRMASSGNPDGDGRREERVRETFRSKAGERKSVDAPSSVYTYTYLKHSLPPSPVFRSSNGLVQSNRRFCLRPGLGWQGR